MKNIKKLIILIFTFVLALGVFAACESLDVESAATVTIKVESAAADVTLVSSRGTVTKSGKTFTIALADRATFFYTISAPTYETYHAEINALDLKDKKTLDLNVTLATKVSSVVTVTSQNSEKVSIAASHKGAKITTKGRTTTIILPGRDESAETSVTISGDGLEPKIVDVKKAEIKYGYHAFSAYLTKIGTVQMELKNYSNETISSINYNTYEGKRIEDSNFFSVPRGEEFLIEGKFFIVNEDTSAYGNLVIDMYGNSSKQNFARKVYINYEDQKNYNYIFIETDNGWEKTDIENDWGGKDVRYYFYVEKPCAIVTIRSSYKDSQTRYYKASWTITEEDITSEKEFKFMNGSESASQEVETLKIEKNFNIDTGEEIVTLPGEYIGDNYVYISDKLYFDGINLIEANYYKERIEIQIPFDKGGLSFDSVTANIYYGKGGYWHNNAEYKNNTIIIDKGVIGYDELLVLNLTFYKRIQIDEYNERDEEVATQRIVQRVNKAFYVGKNYISRIKEKYTDEVFMQTYFEIPNAVKEYAQQNYIPQDWIASIEINGEIVKPFYDWLTNSNCIRMSKNQEFKLSFSPSQYYQYVILRSEKSYTIETLNENSEYYNMPIEIVVPFDGNENNYDKNY